MKTRAKRIAAIFMAAVMTAALAVPAFAAGTVEENTMNFDKVIEAEDDTYQPNQTLTFTIEKQKPTQDETAGTPDPGYPVLEGVEGGVKSPVTIQTDPNATGNKTYTGTFEFVTSKFDAPGIYKYLVTEVEDANNPDMTYAESKYLYVYVKNSDNGGLEVYAASLTDKTNPKDADKKAAEFKNVYKTNGTTNYSFQDLTITKKVEGALGDKEKVFHINLTINSKNRSFYKVTKIGTDGSETDLAQYIVADGAKQYELKSGESIKVYSLSSSDKYSISEKEENEDGYSTTYTDSKGGTGKPSDKNMDEQLPITETITNTRNEVTPTGIIMNYGPYIAMIVAAAVLAFVFLRRKEEL